MNFDILSIVKFGDIESLNDFLFENGIQHQLFWNTLAQKNLTFSKFPIIDADPANLDDWLLAHQVEHQALAELTGQENPFNMLDVDFNNEEQFYDWIGTHLTIHQNIAAVLGVN
jgi:hypothetical protein